MVICAAYGCKSRSDKKVPGITFHRFPSDKDRCKAWVENMKVANWTPSGNDGLCSLHFESHYFYMAAERKRLLNEAVPTIFPQLPSYLQPKKKLKRSTSRSSGRGRSSSRSSERDSSTKPEATSSSTELEMTPSTSGLRRECDDDDTPRKRKLRRQLFKTTVKSREKSQRIRVLRQTLKRCRQKIVSLKHILKSLQTRNLISDENCALLENLTDFNKQMLQRKRGSKQKYSPELRKFAITLSFLSPKAYDYVRQQFNTCLPHQSTIGKWFQTVNAEPGFTSESLRALKAQASHADRPLLCALVIDEIAIRQHVEWDGKRYFGYVDFGVDLKDDTNETAKEAFCIMVVCINGTWKIPVGYFLSNSLNGQQKSSIISQCVQLVAETGVHLVSLTFDGAQSNFSMSRFLGCNFDINNLKLNFTLSNHTIAIFLDPCHVMKLIRNALGEKNSFIDDEGGIIKWEYIELLQQLQENEGLHLGNKLRKAHINFLKQKMKVRLAVQVLSASVADALEYCENQLALPEFQGCSATVKFIRVINNAFDILNSRTLAAPNFKKALCSDNYPRTTSYVQYVIEYISTLKFANNELIIHSRRKTGFIGLIVSLKNAVDLYHRLVVEKQLLIYLPLYKISQDHLELFFSSIRSRGGWNNNPTARQFMGSYKRLLMRAELRDAGLGNCIPLEQINLSSAHSQTIVEPNNTEESLETLFQDHNYIINETMLSECSLQIVIYIAGFVVKHLFQTLKCEVCINALLGNQENFLNSLISQKTRGGLTYPSTDVVAICKKTEEYIRSAQRENTLHQSKAVLALTNSVMEYYVGSNILEELVTHDLEMQLHHRYLLIKCICQKYVNIRIHYIVKKQSEKLDNIRQHLTKTVLFRGQ